MFKTTFPAHFVRLSGEWHDGQSSMLYAVASTGGLNPGTHRRYNSDECRPCTDAEWHVGLFDDLESELRACIQLCKSGRERCKLSRMLASVERANTTLRVRYGVED